MGYDLTILPKQHEFLNSKARHTLYSGSFAAGKSRALCMGLVIRASKPGAAEGLFRKTLVSLRKTTLVTLLEKDGDIPPVLPEAAIESHNKSEHWIKIKNGGKILYGGLDDENKIRSMNLTGCHVDEIIDLFEKDYITLDGRVRVRCRGLRNQLYGATNPDQPMHWVAKRWGCSAEYRTPMRGYVCIRTNMLDNHLLPKDYIESMMQLTGAARERFVFGRWVGADHMVYDAWNREKFVLARPDIEWRRIVIGVDEGYNHPAAAVVLGLDQRGTAHVIDEWVGRKKLESQVVSAVKELVKRYNPESIQCDPAAAKLRAAMREANLPVESADNDVQGGIAVVRNRLAAPVGIPLLTVDPSCEGVIRGFETYESKLDDAGQPTDEPVKSGDDEMDALRYALVAIDGMKKNKMIVPTFDRVRNVVTLGQVPSDWPKWRVVVPREGEPWGAVWCTVAPKGWRAPGEHEDRTSETLIVYRELLGDAWSSGVFIGQVIAQSGDETYAEETLVPPDAWEMSRTATRAIVETIEDAGLMSVPWPENEGTGHVAVLDRLRTMFASGDMLIARDCPNLERQIATWSYRQDKDGVPLPSGMPEPMDHQLVTAVIGWLGVEPAYEQASLDPVYMDAERSLLDLLNPHAEQMEDV
jgi:PBSX family phage terminase large subunit